MPVISTEEDSIYNNLESMSTSDILSSINKEDQKIAVAVHHVIPHIHSLIDTVVPMLKNNGRLFYIGAGTSGRLGILDASECPPTFGVSPNKVIGIIAGGDSAIRQAVEHAEDDTSQAFKNLLEYEISNKDFVLGIASSGNTPYVLGGLRDCQLNGIATGALTSNGAGTILQYADYPISLDLGPEFLTGSTRMKSGTAHKMVLNMISTATMIKLGHVEGNKMVNMQLSNDKLVDRGVRMIKSHLNVDDHAAKSLLLKYNSVKAAIDNYLDLTK